MNREHPKMFIDNELSALREIYEEILRNTQKKKTIFKFTSVTNLFLSKG